MKRFTDFLNEDATNDSVNKLLIIASLIERIRMQSQVAHWNIKGSNFIELHEFFGEIYDKSTEMVDQVVERALAINPMKYVKLNPQFDVQPLHDAKPNIDFLSNRFDTLEILKIADDLDEVSLNMIQEIVAELDKMKWKLDSLKTL